MAMAIDVGYDIEKELNDIRHRMHGTQFEQDMIIIADAISYIQKLKGMSANGSVKHGKWMECTLHEYDPHTDEHWDETYYKCSECGKPCDLLANYCPNCGARMDGE